MTIIANVFPKVRTPKNVAREMSKKCCFTVPFNKQHGKNSKTLFKSERRHLRQIYWSFRKQLTLKKSLLVIWKILRLFVNIFTADDKYSLPNRSNLTQLIQMILSLREKSFVNFFSGVLKYRLNFEHFQIKEMTRNQFRCNYQKDKKLFLNFFLRFWNVDELLNI